MTWNENGAVSRALPTAPIQRESISRYSTLITPAFGKYLHKGHKGDTTNGQLTGLATQIQRGVTSCRRVSRTSSGH